MCWMQGKAGWYNSSKKQEKKKCDVSFLDQTVVNCYDKYRKCVLLWAIRSRGFQTPASAVCGFMRQVFPQTAHGVADSKQRWRGKVWYIHVKCVV